MYQVIFAVRCDLCGQILEPKAFGKSVEFEHDNPADCEAQGVTLPYVSVEDFTKILALNSAPAKPKAAAKRKAK